MTNSELRDTTFSRKQIDKFVNRGQLTGEDGSHPKNESRRRKTNQGIRDGFTENEFKYHRPPKDYEWHIEDIKINSARRPRTDMHPRNKRSELYSKQSNRGSEKREYPDVTNFKLRTTSANS